MKRWILAVTACLTLISVTGLAFGALSAQATVFGNVGGGVYALSVVQDFGFGAGCTYNSNGTLIPHAGLTVQSSGATAWMNVTGMVAQETCRAAFIVTNIGTAPVNLSVEIPLLPFGSCSNPTVTLDCYELFTASGINTFSGVLDVNLVPIFYPTDAHVDIVSLTVSPTFTAPLSTSISFPLTYLGVA